MRIIANFAAQTFSGIFAGFLIAVLILELSMRDATAAVYTQVRQIELEWLDVLATVTLLPALIATALIIATRFRDRTRWLPIIAFALLAGVLILTDIVNLPINADQRDWIVTMPPGDWATIRDRWQLSHAVRTVAATLAFAALCAAQGTRRFATTHSATASGDMSAPSTLSMTTRPTQIERITRSVKASTSPHGK